jgi:hypothetical protein
MDDVSQQILYNSTAEGWSRYFIEKAGGDPVKAKELEAQLNEDIKNAPGEFKHGCSAPSTDDHRPS